VLAHETEATIASDGKIAFVFSFLSRICCRYWLLFSFLFFIVFNTKDKQIQTKYVLGSVGDHLLLFPPGCTYLASFDKTLFWTSFYSFFHLPLESSCFSKKKKSRNRRQKRPDQRGTNTRSKIRNKKRRVRKIGTCPLCFLQKTHSNMKKRRQNQKPAKQQRKKPHIPNSCGLFFTPQESRKTHTQHSPVTLRQSTHVCTRD